MKATTNSDDFRERAERLAAKFVPPDRSEKPDHLARWLTDPRATIFFGKDFPVKLEILVALMNGGGNLAAIGRRHGISRQAVHKHAKACRQIYELPSAKS